MIKKIFKYLIIVILICMTFSVLPLVCGLTTLDGVLSVHGHLSNVTPFWGGFLFFLIVELIGVVSVLSLFGIIGLTFYIIDKL